MIVPPKPSVPRTRSKDIGSPVVDIVIAGNAERHVFDIITADEAVASDMLRQGPSALLTVRTRDRLTASDLANCRSL